MSFCGWCIFRKTKKLKENSMENSEENQQEENFENLTMVENEKDAKECNPRNKCALKPGHSLMDWIRLGSSGCDLAGTKGVITPVTHTELSKHNKINDGWIAIRGKVYNVTRYMDFHPGGVEELMRGVGKDATKLFDEVHAWVNYEQLLAKCFIGPLRSTGTTSIAPEKAASLTSCKSSPKLGDEFKEPTSLNFLNSKSENSLSTINSQSNEIIPRFDWIQKTSDLTIIFYTKSLCNPGLVVEYLSNNEINIKIIIENAIHLCKFNFANEINWPCITKISYETGKIEFILTKSEPALWTSFGTLEKTVLPNYDDYNFDFDVTSTVQITHDSYALVLRPKKRVLLTVPIGFHVKVLARIHGNDVKRSYTPIPSSYVSTSCPSSCLTFLVKSYDSGGLSKYLTRLNPMASSLKVTQPRGSFSLHQVKNHFRVGLLAAGSGITPILSMLDYLLERTSNKLELIQIIFFNKTESDIWCRQKLEQISKKDERIQLTHILSEPEESWTGETGRVTSDIANKLFDSKSSSNVTFCCICGPTPFNVLTLDLLVEAGFNPNNVHSFQG